MTETPRYHQLSTVTCQLSYNCQLQRPEGEEEDLLLTSSSSRWRRVREASAGSLSLTRWCSDLVTWNEDDFYDKDEEEYYNSRDEVNDFLLNDLNEQEQERLNK